MSTLGRFIKRGREGEKDNAAVLILTENGQKFFKEDMIYEMKEYLGEIVIKEVGKTHMDPKRWGQEIQTVMTCNAAVYTKEEFDKMVEIREENNGNRSGH